ncbi:MAG: type I-C CRISPR-associated endonuclease Cas1c [Terrimicrobiaceae bacterium]|nr:type I-C CRISPR-associated endonuclease Cas1c [Terrimicrobiaceae bacterium]
MAEILQNVLYLTTPGLYVARDHLTLRIEQDRTLKLALPIHHLESICILGNEILLSSGAMRLAMENGVAINYLDENGRLQARVSGVPDTSVTLRRAQFRASDNPSLATEICRCVVAGKLHNARNSLLRGARESENPAGADSLSAAAEAIGRLIPRLPEAADPDTVRGLEGAGAQAYFGAFGHLLKQQLADFAFQFRSRQPPRDRVNCLLSFLYALVRHDCISALTAAGLDPFVGFLHVERANRPALALDLMEEFRPWLADRLAVTLINRQQIRANDFAVREGGAVELTDTGRKTLIKAYQERKREAFQHPVLDLQIAIARHFFVQARLLARVLRGDVPSYTPLIPK